MASSALSHRRPHMAVFTFTGDPRAPGTDPLTCELGGVVFTFLTPQSVDDPALIDQLRRHSHFTETGGAANLGDFDGDKKPGGSIVAVAGLKAIHKGRGKYVITDGTDTLAEGLDKHDADTFNDLSDVAKAAKLAAFIENRK